MDKHFSKFISALRVSRIKYGSINFQNSTIRGGCSVIRRAKYFGDDVMVKSNDSNERAMEEAILLGLLQDNPLIVGFRGITSDENKKVYLVLDYEENGDL